MADENSIAIVGMAGRFPGARSINEYWSMLAAGKDATRWLTAEELLALGESKAAIEDSRYVRATMPLPDMEMFDAGFFGFSPREASILDPQHRHFLECCWEALEDAGRTPTEAFDGHIGVFGGCGMQAYLAFNLLTNPELVEREGMFLLRHTGNDKDFLTTRVSYLLDLHGPSVSIQTACSTSLVAVHAACQSLLSRECDMALAGGSSIVLPHGRGYLYAEGEILSSTGRCRAFDDEADGTLFGSGVGVIALRRLDDALRDGDNIHAVVLGSAINNDGARKAGYFAPSVDGQARAAAEALALAGVQPQCIDYIEAHGTGTLVGDPIELSALQQAYGTAPAGSIGIGSVKTNIGHLDTAAGVASLIKVVLAMKGQTLPATLNFSVPNSRFDFAHSPFTVTSQIKDWRRGERPRRASVNSLGVGGTNAHVVLEEAPPQELVEASEPQIIALSAKTPSALDRLVAKWREFVVAPGPNFSLANAAFTTQVGRKAFPCRTAIVARDVGELAEKLTPSGAWKRSTAKAIDGSPRIVFMFPGGGAQHPNAARALYESNKVFRAAVEACFSALAAPQAAELRALMFEAVDIDAASAALERPTYSLLAVFIVEYALAKLWESWGIVPDAVIGHSAGEYAAAVHAGIMSLEDAIAVVLERGAIFESAPPGGMLSVQSEEARVREMLGENLDLAVVNAPQLTVVSGALEPLSEFARRLEAEGIKHAHVRIKVAAHSRMLDGGLERFRARLASVSLSAPKIDFISNLEGGQVGAEAFATPEYWVKHLRTCVHFASGLSVALSTPDTVLVEVGPGQGLSSLASLIEGDHAPLGIVATSPSLSEPSDEETFALSAFGRLWALGVPVDFSRVRSKQTMSRISLPTYAFERTRHWIEPGRGLVVEQPSRPQLQRRTNISTWFESRVFEPAPVAGDTAPQRGRTHVIFSDGSEAGESLIAQLRTRGDTCTVVRHGQPSATDDGGEFVFDACARDYGPMIEAISAANASPDTIIFLWPLLFTRAKNFAAFDAAFALGKALQLSGWGEKALFLAATQNALPVDRGVACDAMQAGVLGPWRMLASEQADARIRLIDLDATDGATERAEILSRELGATGEAPVVAWRRGQRFAPALRPIDPSSLGQVLRKEGVYLITGGLGGIGLELARYLARTIQARLVLTGRTPVPPRERWEQCAAGWGSPAEVVRARELLELEGLGGRVLALSADVANPVAMRNVLAVGRAEFGSLHGVFHAAGLIDDKPMAMKTLEEAHHVLESKARGASVLDELLPDGSLDVFAVFSSTSVLIAPPGQSDYVAANAVAETIAASRRDGMVITWGVWADVGMAKRAADAAATGKLGTEHPLLGGRHDAKDGVLEFFETYSEATHWVLSEHRISDVAVLPGAAYVEIASAAALRAGLGDTFELSQINFFAPLAVAPRQSRHVRTRLTPSGKDAYRIEVESRAHAGEAWILHFDAHLEGGKFTPDRLVPGHCDKLIGKDRLALTERGVAFGPRWRNVTRVAIGKEAAIADFVLPEAFASDLETYRIHPALFDTSFASGLFLLDNDVKQGVLAPVSIGSVRLFAAFGGVISSVCRLTSRSDSAATFDVDVKDASGAMLAQIRDVSFRRIAFSADTSAATDLSASTRDRLLMEGIRASEAQQVFQHLFAQSARSVVVSPVAVADAASALRAPSAAASSATGGKAGGSDNISDDPVEQRIAQMCAEILGIDTVGPDDEFLSYGGGSLTGVRLFARIRRELGVELALSALLQAPTIRALAALVREHMPQSKEAEQTQETEKPAAPRSRWTPLVRMVEGSPNVKPLFLIHGAKGNILWFKSFADLLRDGSPIYGVEAQGIDGSLPFLETIEDMAALYVRHILTVDAKGPYRLMGYSGGGIIAIEMAHQLRKSGRKVELLVMLDTLAPEEARKPVGHLEKLMLLRKMSATYSLRWFYERARSTLDRVLAKLGMGSPEYVKSHIEILADDSEVAYMGAQHRYYPPQYEGDVVLFRADHTGALSARAGMTLGWHEHVRGNLEVIRLDAGHDNLLVAPALYIVLDEMRRRLATLNNRKALEAGPARAPVGAVSGPSRG